VTQPTEDKIKSGMTVDESIQALSGFSGRAADICRDMLRHARLMEEMRSRASLLKSLDRFRIYECDICKLLNEVCFGDIAQMIFVLLTVERDNTGRLLERLKSAIENCGADFNLEQAVAYMAEHCTFSIS
jgi:hypothetical protein